QIPEMKFINYGIDFSVDNGTVMPQDLVVAGIIDPAKVLRVALESAVSIANLLLTSDNVITTVEVGNEEPNM
ncbi:hypothetical protein J6W34_00770, partial [bacterium]|nr:hypothetical protein [bacterium]